MAAPKIQALLWPQLLYAMAQVAGKDMDRCPLGRIWVQAADPGHLRLTATDGVALLVAKVPSTHGLGAGQVGWLNPADFLKKPAISHCNAPGLVELEAWEGGADFLQLSRVKPMLAGPETRAPFDPARAARFFKAVSAVAQRVDARLFKKATFVRCPHPEFPGEVRGVLANLAIKKA